MHTYIQIEKHDNNQYTVTVSWMNTRGYANHQENRYCASMSEVLIFIDHMQSYYEKMAAEDNA